MQQRLAVIQAGAMIRPEPGYFRMLSGDLTEGGLPDLSAEEGRHELDGAIGDAQVVFLDNRATLMRTARENEADDWVGMQDWLLEQRRQDRAIVILDHAGKSGFQRGTTRREDVLDTMVKLRRPENYRPDQGARFVVEFTKARGVWGDDALPFIAQYEEYNGAAVWTRIALGDEAEEKVAEMTTRGMSVRAIARETGISKSRVQSLRDQAIQREIFDKGNQE
jgi:putative DNA primase/helicase